MPPSEELLDRIVKQLHAHPLGLSRKDLARLCGFKSTHIIGQAVTVLLSRGKIKVLPMWGASAQKFTLTERNTL